MTTKTKLNEEQILRLINTIDVKNDIRSAYVCQVNGASKIAINYINGEKESFYPMDDDLNFIVNGIVLTRNPKQANIISAEIIGNSRGDCSFFAPNPEAGSLPC